ncbi:MerR family transcriptional regulator [Paenibacillus sanfengchensis]|uniref:MerR family transcriptional regulator n=1 Tax=Paenibacillus sanfengchensis TaxID=3119819 RepID=UPI002FE051B5
MGEFSVLTGLSIDTLRYYEKEHLIRVARNAAGRRCYTEDDQNWILFIKRLKETGMAIKEIRDYAGLRYQGDMTMQSRLSMLTKHRLFVLAEKKKWEDNLKHLDDKIRIYEEKTNGGFRLVGNRAVQTETP